jgi:hypothetical protein
MTGGYTPGARSCAPSPLRFHDIALNLVCVYYQTFLRRKCLYVLFFIIHKFIPTFNYSHYPSPICEQAQALAHQTRMLSRKTNQLFLISDAIG